VPVRTPLELSVCAPIRLNREGRSPAPVVVVVDLIAVRVAGRIDEYRQSLRLVVKPRILYTNGSSSEATEKRHP